jgi:hypothetical protein
MRSNDPESMRLYDLNAQWTSLSQQLQCEKDENKRSKLERELFEVEYQIDTIHDMREGEDHIQWLLSEFGEDVFPDRD